MIHRETNRAIITFNSFYSFQIVMKPPMSFNVPFKNPLKPEDDSCYRKDEVKKDISKSKIKPKIKNKQKTKVREKMVGATFKTNLMVQFYS